MPLFARSLLALTIGTLVLTGCSHRQATRTVRSAPAPTVSEPASHRAHAPTSDRRSSSLDASDTAETALPDETGIAACDDYLASYIACHRAAAIYSPEQLPLRYQAMRTSLLRDSKNPEIRPQLGARCNSLASQLRQALHGKSCAEEPASGASTP